MDLICISLLALSFINGCGSVNVPNLRLALTLSSGDIHHNYGYLVTRVSVLLPESVFCC